MGGNCKNARLIFFCFAFCALLTRGKYFEGLLGTVADVVQIFAALLERGVF